MRNEWQRKTLGEVAQIGAGNSAPQEEILFVNGTHPFFRTSDAGRIRFGDIFDSADYLNDEGIKGLRKFPKGTILFPKSGASTFLNHRVMLGIEGYVSSHLATIVGDETKVNRQFLLYFLTTIEAQKLIQDHSYPSLNLPIIAGIQVLLPTLREQQQIVDILDEVFKEIVTAKTNAYKNLKNVQDLFESQLHAMFTQHDEKWVRTTLRNVLSVQPQNGWSPPAANHSSSGIPVLTLSSVTGFQFRADKIKFTSAKTNQHRHYWVRNGDFLITRSNTPELVGHVAIASGITEPTIYPDLIMLMTPAPDRILTEFLYYQMRTPLLRQEITGRAQGANPTMKKINKSAVQSLPIVVPSLSLQKKIVAHLDTLSVEVQRLESIYQRKLISLEALKKSVLHLAFSGNLKGCP